ncbi:hypothetical protein ACL7TT_07425 [Microbulbifer sp. 2304DJ12-6]|nr:hypothetical protein [uncultured Microbulbifer sp.]
MNNIDQGVGQDQVAVTHLQEYRAGIGGQSTASTTCGSYTVGVG